MLVLRQGRLKPLHPWLAAIRNDFAAGCFTGQIEQGVAYAAAKRWAKK
jgi:hypothetical protein